VNHLQDQGDPPPRIEGQDAGDSSRSSNMLLIDPDVVPDRCGYSLKTHHKRHDRETGDAE
ncbi:MAG TPA: hypothetical protein VH681_03550, partial [Nitrospiraceae bacterium]